MSEEVKIRRVDRGSSFCFCGNRYLIGNHELAHSYVNVHYDSQSGAVLRVESCRCGEVGFHQFDPWRPGR